MDEKGGLYTLSTPSLAQQRAFSALDRKVLAGILVIALAVRLYGLAWPASVVFDEVHFGGFARKYIIGRFFFDVHPPLAKMLFAVVGYLGGFRGDFTFENIGDDYIGPAVPYVTLRLLPSILGIFTIALCYATLRASGCRTSIAATGALLLTFENTHATESRYILLDSPLLFFIALTVYGFKKFELEVPFTKNWYKFLTLTGLGLGATVSSKWVGLFTISWVGLLTIQHLWELVGDLSVSFKSFVKHFSFRALFLIGLPLAFYTTMFLLHFSCVDNVGDGADFMPRAFSATLKHNKLPFDIPANVGYGSSISIRHVNTGGGYLHSHAHNYETGSQQQQVTLYPHVDENNIWVVENGTEAWNPDGSPDPVWLKDGNVIRLMHKETQKRLHSHDHRPPVTNHDYLYEVSAYGFEGFEGDANDNWRVQIVRQESVGDGKNQVQALRTYFQLQHTLLGCLLYSKKVKLPAWGFEQQEVSCIRNGALHHTLWYVEHNSHPDYKDPELVSYQKPGFFRKFIDLNKAMWRVNKGLTEPHNWESRPLSWLTLRRGINMWGQNNRQVYLVGNLPIYLSITGIVFAYLVFKVVQLLLWQRFSQPGQGLPIPTRKVSESSAAASQTAFAMFDRQLAGFILGWLLHFVPSFFMVRQLFLHHYLASVYFGVLAVSQVLELVCVILPWRRAGNIVSGLFLAAAVTWFVWYSPLIYGTRWTKAQCEAAVFHDMDFDCNLFLQSLGDYEAVNAEFSASSSSAKLGLTPEPTAESVETIVQPADENEQVVVGDVVVEAPAELPNEEHVVVEEVVVEAPAELPNGEQVVVE